MYLNFSIQNELYSDMNVYTNISYISLEGFYCDSSRIRPGGVELEFSRISVGLFPIRF